MWSFDLETVKRRAMLSYTALPYHNFAHALDVLRRAELLMDRCEADHVVVNRPAVQLACLYHDAGYESNHLELGFPTKEWLAAQIAREDLSTLRCPSKLIAGVMAIIYASDIDAAIRTTEDKVMRAADIGNLAELYEQFIDANQRLKKEFEQLHGSPVTWAHWKVKTTMIIDRFYRQDIRLTRWHDDEHGRSDWHMRTLANLGRFLEDPKFTDP